MFVLEFADVNVVAPVDEPNRRISLFENVLAAVIDCVRLVRSQLADATQTGVELPSTHSLLTAPARPVRGRAVPLVRLTLDGVPSAGVTSVGLVASTTEPEPVVPLLKLLAAS